MSIKMWTKMEAYQPYADKAGHGESWKRMTTERTRESMLVAVDDASAKAAWAAWAAENAAYAAAVDAAAWAAQYEAKAIKCITRAIKEAQS